MTTLSTNEPRGPIFVTTERAMELMSLKYHAMRALRENGLIRTMRVGRKLLWNYRDLKNLAENPPTEPISGR